ncbi:MAG: polymer-forming cytoskeletal protein [Lachnospiraceae bacterium]|nr:polymer-forming cytoskeletal protein [Lachnospiraceae bacterium]
MSIFKDVKEDGQKKDDLFTVISEDEQEEVDMELLESLMEDDSLVEADEEEAQAEALKEAEEPKEEEVQAAAEEKKEDSVEEKSRGLEHVSADTSSVTVITKGTTINGSIISDCSLDVMGTINGDIECLGKLTISGKVKGNAVASEVYVNTDRLEGSIMSEGSVKIGLGTVVIGDISAASGVIAGAVKGEIDIKGPIVIDSTAIIKGNVKAKSVQMNNGAVLEGFCSLSYAAVEIDTIFE